KDEVDEDEPEAHALGRCPRPRGVAAHGMYSWRGRRPRSGMIPAGATGRTARASRRVRAGGQGSPFPAGSALVGSGLHCDDDRVVFAVVLGEGVPDLLRGEGLVRDGLLGDVVEICTAEGHAREAAGPEPRLADLLVPCRVELPLGDDDLIL